MVRNIMIENLNENEVRCLERCSDCICLCVGKDNTWECDEVGKPCVEIAVCPEEEW